MTRINVHGRSFGARARANVESSPHKSHLRMHVNVRFHHFPSSKDGVEPYGKSVSLFCELQVDLRRVKLSAMYPRWTMDDGTYNGDGTIIVCSGAQVLALRKVKYDRLHHTRRKVVNIVSGR